MCCWQFVLAACLLRSLGVLRLLGAPPLAVSIAQVVAAMCFSGLLIHLGHGMIEMHFHIFVMLALMTLYGFSVADGCGGSHYGGPPRGLLLLDAREPVEPSLPHLQHCPDSRGARGAGAVPCSMIAWKLGRFIQAEQLAQVS